MKNKMFMFLIVFSLMLGIFGSVYAYNGATTSAKVVPTVLKISGDLNVSGIGLGSGYNLTVKVNDQLVAGPVGTGTREEVSAFLRNGFFTEPFSSAQTGTTDKNIFVKVLFNDSSTEKISTTVQIPNPNYNKGYLIADNVVNNSITPSKLNTLYGFGPSNNKILSYGHDDAMNYGFKWIDAPTGSGTSYTGTTPITVSGTVISLDNLGVTNGKIADGAVTTSKLGNSSVTTDKINNYSVTPTKLSDDVYSAIYCNSKNILAYLNNPTWGVLSFTDCDTSYLPSDNLVEVTYYNPFFDSGSIDYKLAYDTGLTDVHGFCKEMGGVYQDGSCLSSSNVASYTLFYGIKNYGTPNNYYITYWGKSESSSKYVTELTCTFDGVN